MTFHVFSCLHMLKSYIWALRGEQGWAHEPNHLRVPSSIDYLDKFNVFNNVGLDLRCSIFHEVKKLYWCHQTEDRRNSISTTNGNPFIKKPLSRFHYKSGSPHIKLIHFLFPLSPSLYLHCLRLSGYGRPGCWNLLQFWVWVWGALTFT